MPDGKHPKRHKNRARGGAENNVSMLQLNFNRCGAAHDLAEAYARDNAIDVILGCEPNGKVKNLGIEDRNKDCFIGLVSNRRLVDKFSGKGYAMAVFDNVGMFSCYFSPNGRDSGFESLLDDLSAHLRDLKAFNEGGVATFIRKNGESIIDVTLGNVKMAGCNQNWRVMEGEETLSDHRAIRYDVKLGTCRGGDTNVADHGAEPDKERKVRWKLTERNVVAFEENWGDLFGNYEGQTCKEVIGKISGYCDKYIGRGRFSRPPVYWRNDEIKSDASVWSHVGNSPESMGKGGRERHP
ncbi:uncharacterized protein [Euwallacea fornicatus]|uniref:uncharacterized protein n=1 Tax=Euwallacea fornicatus TaxID=995702 RepID=UPI00338F69C4